MPEKRKIKANLPNLLTYIGQLYRNPRDAVKEYVSNAVDRYIELRSQGHVQNGQCHIQLILTSHSVIIRSHSQAGQDRQGLRTMMQNVADSMKINLGVPQIGRLAIGIFAFNQFASRAELLSKADKDGPTWKLTLMRNSDEYELEESLKREALPEPGMDVRISGLLFDPTRVRSSLSPPLICRYLAEWYDFYIREGMLDIVVIAKGQQHPVLPPEIDLPPVGQQFSHVLLKGDPNRGIATRLWFEPSGTGHVALRNSGLPIVEDMRRLDEVKLGFQHTVYASGFLSGVIDIDFLRPLPARTGFEMDDNFNAILDWLDEIEPSLKREIEEYRLESEIKQLEGIKDKAKQMAMEILNLEPFQQLELLGGRKRQRRKNTEQKVVHAKGKETGKRSGEGGNKPASQGLRFLFKEEPLADKWVHSHFDAVRGQLICNTANPNYKIMKSEKAKLRYSTLLIGKETIGYNDKTKQTDYYLEKLLAYLFAVEAKLS